MATIVTLIVVLGMLPAAVNALVVRATAIVNAMLANKSTFTSPNPPLTQVTANIATLASAEAAVKTRAAGTRVARDDARKVVLADLRLLHAYVQQLVRANPAQAEAIAAAAAMTLRKVGAHYKSPLTIKHVVSGTVKIVAKATKGARSYEWQTSTDGGKTWVTAAPSAQSSTTISGLVPNVLTHFRQRVVTKAGPGDWSEPVSALVS
jgi:hypothetical protein